MIRFSCCAEIMCGSPDITALAFYYSAIDAELPGRILEYKLYFQISDKIVQEEKA